jgi:hypothetical protein
MPAYAQQEINAITNAFSTTQRARHLRILLTGTVALILAMFGFTDKDKTSFGQRARQRQPFSSHKV